jgi:hypothetical protein
VGSASGPDCEALGGAQYTRAIITLGTPHRGAAVALDKLVNGRWGPFSLRRSLRSMPSVYELLPLYPLVRVESDEGVKWHRLAELFGLHPVTGEGTPCPPASLPALNALDGNLLQQALKFHAEIRVPAMRCRSRSQPGLRPRARRNPQLTSFCA